MKCTESNKSNCTTEELGILSANKAIEEQGLEDGQTVEIREVLSTRFGTIKKDNWQGQVKANQNCGINSGKIPVDSFCVDPKYIYKDQQAVETEIKSRLEKKGFQFGDQATYESHWSKGSIRGRISDDISCPGVNEVKIESPNQIMFGVEIPYSSTLSNCIATWKLLKVNTDSDYVQSRENLTQIDQGARVFFQLGGTKIGHVDHTVECADQNEAFFVDENNQASQCIKYEDLQDLSELDL